MNLLITGATGHTGLFFLEKLNENPQTIKKVRCIVRPSSNTKSLLQFKNIDIEIVKGEIKNNAFLERAVQDMDVIFNIANIRFSPMLEKAARKSNVHWIIGVHTTGRYSQFKSASEEYIRIEDKMLKERNIDLTILRPTMIYGSMKDHNMSKLVKFLDKTPFFPIFGNGKNLLQPVRAQDLAQAYYDVLINPEITKNKEYNLSGKDEIEYLTIIKLITQELNKKVKYIKLPINLSYKLATFGQKFIPFFPIKNEQVLRMQEDKVFSHELARNDFGYDPMSFNDGIKIEVNEYKEMVK